MRHCHDAGWVGRLVTVLLAAVIIACGPDDGPPSREDDPSDQDNEETADDTDEDALERTICAEDGFFDHYDPGACTSSDRDSGEAYECPAGSVCLASDHCVGQGGAGPIGDSCRDMTCGVLDCLGDCTCVEPSVCSCD